MPVFWGVLALCAVAVLVGAIAVAIPCDRENFSGAFLRQLDSSEKGFVSCQRLCAHAMLADDPCPALLSPGAHGELSSSS